MKREIVLGGGCFWGVQAYFKLLEGIFSTEVGYANGNKENPSYEEVYTDNTGFVEAIYLTYDDEVISLAKILDAFFLVVNPTELNYQAHDIGTRYRNGIYYINVEDGEFAREYVSKLQEKYSEKVVTEVEVLKNYYPAEQYHQDYLDKNPNGYCHIDIKKYQK